MSDLTKELFKNEKRGFTKYPWYSSYYSMMVYYNKRTKRKEKVE